MKKGNETKGILTASFSTNSATLEGISRMLQPYTYDTKKCRRKYFKMPPHPGEIATKTSAPNTKKLDEGTTTPFARIKFFSQIKPCTRTKSRTRWKYFTRRENFCKRSNPRPSYSMTDIKMIPELERRTPRNTHIRIPRNAEKEIETPRIRAGKWNRSKEWLQEWSGHQENFLDKRWTPTRMLQSNQIATSTRCNRCNTASCFLL